MNQIQKKIYNSILHQISNGELATGDKLPTETKLAEQFDTNRMNAHLAVKALEEAGLVRRNKRQGTFVEKKIAEDEFNSLKWGVSNLVIVLATPAEKRNKIHWDESTLFEFEYILQQNNIKVHFEEIPETSEELAEIIKKIANINCCYLAILPDKGDTSLIMDNIEELRNVKTEVIMLDRGAIPLDAFPFHTVGYNPYEEGMAVGYYLKEKPDCKITVIDSAFKTNVSYWAQQRYNGICFALKKEPDFQHINMEELPQQAYNQISKATQKLCIVAINDKVAVNIINYCKNKGLIAGQDYDLISFDNSATFRKYNLTTVAHPMDKIASTIAEIIIKPFPWKKDFMRAKISLKPFLIKRQTG